MVCTGARYVWGKRIADSQTAPNRLADCQSGEATYTRREKGAASSRFSEEQEQGGLFCQPAPVIDKGISSLALLTGKGRHYRLRLVLVFTEK